MTRVAGRVIMLAALAFPAVAGAQGKIERGAPFNRDGAIRIYNDVGSVRVTGWERDSVSVRGTTGTGSSFHFGGDRSGVKMFVEGRNVRNPSASVLEVMVPAGARVWVKTASADIEVAGVTGSLDLYVVGGRITVTGTPADVNAEAIDGRIAITGSPGWVRAKSASGDVSFSGSSQDVTLSTVSGRIDLRGTAFERGRVESVTGNISFQGVFRRGGLGNFDTHSGGITVLLPGESPADLEVVSVAGTIANRLTSARPVKGRYGRGSELVTANAGGGARIVVRTFKGEIVLGRLPSP